MDISELHKVFESKINKGIFRPVERYLHPDLAEDRLQEGMGHCWRILAKKIRAGVMLDDALMVHIVRVRACDLRRQLVPSNGSHRTTDAMNPVNYAKGRVEVMRLGGAFLPDADAKEEDHDLIAEFMNATARDPAGEIISTIDLTAWLGTLNEDDRMIVHMRARGDTLAEIGDAFGHSISWAKAHCGRLGSELADRCAGIHDGAASTTRRPS